MRVEAGPSLPHAPDSFRNGRRELREVIGTVSERRTLLIVTLEIGKFRGPALVDCGATNSCVGQEGIEILEKSGFTRRTTPPRVSTVANGQLLTCTEEIVFQAQLRDRLHTFVARIQPKLPLPFLLGLNSLETLGMVVDRRRKSWHFTGEDGEEFPFDLVEGPKGRDISTPIVELSGSEAKRLEVFFR